jgi:hypothetical protein
MVSAQVKLPLLKSFGRTFVVFLSFLVFTPIGIDDAQWIFTTGLSTINIATITYLVTSTSFLAALPAALMVFFPDRLRNWINLTVSIISLLDLILIIACYFDPRLLPIVLDWVPTFSFFYAHGSRASNIQ